MREKDRYMTSGIPGSKIRVLRSHPALLLTGGALVFCSVFQLIKAKEAREYIYINKKKENPFPAISLYLSLFETDPIKLFKP